MISEPPESCVVLVLAFPPYISLFTLWGGVLNGVFKCLQDVRKLNEVRGMWSWSKCTPWKSTWVGCVNPGTQSAPGKAGAWSQPGFCICRGLSPGTSVLDCNPSLLPRSPYQPMDERTTAISSQMEKGMAQEGNITKKHKWHLEYLFSSVYGMGSSKNTDLHLILCCYI